MERPLWRNKAANLISYLAKIEAAKTGESRKIMANLRRGLADPANTAVMAPYLARWIQSEGEWQRFCYYAGAALFALHPVAAQSGNFGNHLALLPRHTPSLDDDVTRLVETGRDALYGPVQRWVRRLKAADVPVNYPDLICDMIAWGHPSRFVQRAWLLAYFSVINGGQFSPEINSLLIGGNHV